jgi:elongation factor 1-beta
LADLLKMSKASVERCQGTTSVSRGEIKSSGSATAAAPKKASAQAPAQKQSNNNNNNNNKKKSSAKSNNNKNSNKNSNKNNNKNNNKQEEKAVVSEFTLDDMESSTHVRSTINGYMSGRFDAAKLWTCTQVQGLTPPVKQERKAEVAIAAKPAAKPPAAKEEKPAAAPKDDDDDDDDDDDSESSEFDLDESDDDEETKKLFAAKAEKIKEIQKRQAGRKHKAKSNLTVDVKPFDSETDMNEIHKQVRAIEKEGLKWLGGTLKDIAFGLKKLRITAQLTDILINPDDVTEAIEDIDGVQSTDVYAFQMA